MENMTSPGTLLSGDNATWLEEYYQTWLRTPEQLPEDWRRFFLSPELTVQSVSGDNNISGATLKKQAAVIQLINAWRTQGHLRAKLDPLGLNPPADVPSLQPGFWGLSEEDLLQEFSVTFGAHTTQMPLKQLLNLLEQAWASSQAYELAHLENREEINWLLSRIESSNAPQADAQTCIARFEKLMAAETLERYLHTRYVGQKRFSLEGGESAIPALDTLTKRLRAQGVEEMVIGMAHRGRLNVLVNLLNKDPAQLFAEFEGKQTIDLPAMVNEGTFRADLLDRLAFDVVQLPPLRERESDIMLMAEHFAIQMCREIKLPLFPGFTEHARETLLNYRWPGNIRELKNVVERSVYRHGTSDYPLDDIIIDPFKRRPSEEAIAVSENTSLPTLPLDLREFQMQQEKELLQVSLEQGKYNQKRAAELLGLTYHQFRALLKKHQL